LKESETTLNNLKDAHQVFVTAAKLIPHLNNQVVNGGDLESGRSQEERKGLIDGHQKSINIERVAGVIDSEDVNRFKRLIFRSTKGKSFVHTEQFIDQDDPDNKDQKSVYIVTFQDGGFLRDKIQRICDSFSGQRYDLPEVTELQPQIQRMQSSIQNQKTVFERTKHQLRQQLIEFDRISEGQTTSSTIFIYKMFLSKEKGLYMTLNQMRASGNTFIGYFWAAEEYEMEIRNAMAQWSASQIVVVQDNYGIMPPTYNK
jgi:vacuolar-type H+-ATPase subunit I/STV1